MRTLTKTPEQKRLDALEMEATRFAAHLSALILRERSKPDACQSSKGLPTDPTAVPKGAIRPAYKGIPSKIG